jgi:hypothetical protein
MCDRKKLIWVERSKFMPKPRNKKTDWEAWFRKASRVTFEAALLLFLVIGAIKLVLIEIHSKWP